MIYIDKNLKTYKGNLHAHTTRSDGKHTPEQLVNVYKDNGYDFVSFSDHRYFSDTHDFDQDDFIIINAYEMTSEGKPENKLFHIHGIIHEDRPRIVSFEHDEKHIEPLYKGVETVQQVIDEIRERGMVAVVNHPKWSRNTFEELLQLNDYFAVEIYNHKAEVRDGIGSSTEHWDYLLDNGKKVFGLAGDDSHDLSVNDKMGQYFGGWVMIQSKALTQKSIVNALLDGNFYSTTGPIINHIEVIDNEIVIECSAVEKVRFLCKTLRRGALYKNMDGSPVTNATYKLKGDELYIRIECVDYNGKIAYSNPIFLEDLKGNSNE